MQGMTIFINSLPPPGSRMATAVSCPASGQQREGADAPPGGNLLFVEMAAVLQPWTKSDVGCK